MPLDLAYSDELLRSVLTEVRTIAMLGASANPERPSNGVMRFLQQHGYRVIPVNPGIAGRSLHGEQVYARLADIPNRIDMVEVFRNRAALAAAADDTIAVGAKVLWLQLGLVDEDAAVRAKAAGLTVIMNRCPAIEIPRLIGDANPHG